MSFCRGSRRPAHIARIAARCQAPGAAGAGASRAHQTQGHAACVAAVQICLQVRVLPCKKFLHRLSFYFFVCGWLSC